MEVLDHMVVLLLIFWGTSILFSMVVVPMYIPTDSAQGSPFLPILAKLVISCLFDDSLSNRCEVISYCDFDMHLPDD